MIMPKGNRNMFTTECSKPMKKNSMIGIHMAMALPPTVVEIMAPTTPGDTIQLHSMPRRKMVAQPAAPYWASQGAVLTDMGDALAHLTGLDGEAVGEDEGHHYRHGQLTGKVAEKHPAPVAQDARYGHPGASIQQRQRGQHEHPGQQVEAHHL